MDSKVRRANRVFQLESHNLNHEFEKIVDQFVESLDIPSVSQETALLIKLYLFGNYIKHNTTIGMKVFNIGFYDTGDTDQSLNTNPRSYKLVLLATFNLILPYITKKYNNIDNLIGGLKISWLTFENIIMIFKSLSLLNFLIFLRNGKHLVLQERILGLEQGMSDQDYYNNMSMNKIQMELINRDAIWRALAEFLTAVIPYINTARIKNQALRISGLMPKMTKETKLSDKISRKEHVEKCAICGKQPFNPHVIGCRHVFCYYCLHSTYLSDPTGGYACLLCKYSTKDESQVQRYRIHELPRIS